MGLGWATYHLLCGHAREGETLRNQMRWKLRDVVQEMHDVVGEVG